MDERISSIEGSVALSAIDLAPLACCPAYLAGGAEMSDV
jgi:hypothetical protein